MKCQFCNSLDSKVVDSRLSEDGASIRRRRECTACGKRFTTYETIETTPLVVVKKSGAREAFKREKVRAGIETACEKRPVPSAAKEELVESIEKAVINHQEQEVTTKFIGELVMEGLKKLDDVAYVRFAAVHRQFKDINSWFEEITEILNDKKK